MFNINSKIIMKNPSASLFIAAAPVITVSFYQEIIKRLLLFLAVCGIAGAASAAVPVTTGLQLHLQADSLGLSDGATVSSWADLAGGDNNAINTGGSPTYVANGLNGHAVVSITGSLSADGYIWTGQENDYFNLSSSVHNIQTVAMVFRRTSNNYYGGNISMFGSDPTGWVNEAFNGDGSYGTAYWGNGADPAVGWGDLRVNGVSVGSGNGKYTSVPANYHIMLFQIQQGWGSDININQIASATDNNSHVWGMDVAELLVYDTFLSASDVTAVETYLTDKYFVVPEPTGASLVGLGVAAFFAMRRKLQK